MICVSSCRRLVLPPKAPRAYGKWAIVTGTTSGIGKEFAAYLVEQGMSLLIISRTESKLIEQKKELAEIATQAGLKAQIQEYEEDATDAPLDDKSVRIRHLAYDFTDMVTTKDEFYRRLDRECARMDKDGGLGLLINNVGTANEIPMTLDEFTGNLMVRWLLRLWWYLWC